MARVILVVLLFGQLFTPALAAASATTQKSVLALYLFEKATPGAVTFDQSLRVAFQSLSTPRIIFFTEYLDLSSMRDEASRQDLIRLCRLKYAHHKLDLVVVAGIGTAENLISAAEEVSPGTPIIFNQVGGPFLPNQPMRPGVTGVVMEAEFQKNLELALTLQPDTRRVVVVAGVSEGNQYLLNKAREEFRQFEGKIEFTYLTNLTIEGYRQAVAKLPAQTIILYLALARDAAGETFYAPDALSLLAKAANAPIYGIAETYLGHGIIGGRLLSFEAAGIKVAEMGARILRGEDPSNLPLSATGTSLDLFDWQQLQRWGISADKLPPGSIVRYQEATFWQPYKPYIIGALVLLFAQALLIVLLLPERMKRRRDQARLADKERHLREAQSLAHLGNFRWDLKTNAVSWSEEVYRIYGLEPGDSLTYETYFEHIHPEHREQIRQAVERALNHRESLEHEYRILRAGEERWVFGHIEPVVDADGKLIALQGICQDITERKQAEGALKQSEQRLRLAQRAARVGTWDWNLTTGESNWSEGIYELLGLAPGDGHANLDDFVGFIHPEDRAPTMAQVESVIRSGEDYYGEFRIIRRDGSTAWLASKGRVIRDASGSAERLIGVNLDITERKRAEEELKASLSNIEQLKEQLQAENIYLQEEIKLHHNFDQIIGNSNPIKYVLFKIEQVAPTDTAVLLLGETGTGKELAAHAIHDLSPRKNRPLIKVNCAALPATLIESELFGHEKGAFTGAQGRKAGRFEVANGGTIFLDEIGELPLELQPKLLRVLQEGEFERLGGSQTIKVNVRVIAATNRNLKMEAEQGRFRQDLWYRLNVFPVTLPPLRQRTEDLPLLIRFFADKFSQKLGKRIESIAPSMIQKIEQYSWPGNIRELANVIERAVISSQGPVLTLADKLESKLEAALRSRDNRSLEEMERDYILQRLEETHWKIEGPQGAAQSLRINPSTLRNRMIKLGISKTNVHNPTFPQDGN